MLLIGVLFFSTFALARPQWGEEKKKVERKGVDLAFLLDTSLSMLAEDAKPNRLLKSKLEIKNMIRRLKGDRVGMVAFAGSSFLQCPLTLDYSAFLLFVDALKPGYIPSPGTSLSQAIDLAIRAFPAESRKYKALIIFSDGEDHEGGMDQALEAAKKSGSRVYTIGMGTPEGEPIPLRSATDGKIAGYKKDREGQVVITRLNADLLTRVSKETGGLYLPATAGEKEIDIILKHLETLGERKLREQLVTEREEHFQLFLLIAFLCLVGETLWGERRRSLARFSLSLLAFFVFCGFLDSPRSLVEKGNRLAEQKKYQSAVENYRKAEVARPHEPVIRYNLGTSLYQLYQFRDAEKELEQALSRTKDPATKAKVLYNYGNTQYRLGDFEKAVEAYKKVLDLDPQDADAKYNLEFLRKKKAQFEKKNDERRQEQKQQKQPQPQKQNQQEQPQQPKPEQGSGQEKQQTQPQQGEGQEPKSQSNEGQDQQQEEKQEEKDQSQGQGTESKQQEQEQQEEQKQEQGSQTLEQKSEEKSEEKIEPRPAGAQGEEPKREPQDGKGEKQEEQPSEPTQGQEPLQGQMSHENALRILDALQEGEKRLHDLRRPPVRSGDKEILKDW